MLKENLMKRKLKNGEVVIGTWILGLRTPYITKMIANAGFDYIQIDMEHSGMSMETVADLCFAASLSGIVPVVRPSGKTHYLVSRPLDCGALGLLIPHVDTPEEAEAIVRWAKYPPLGERGAMLLGLPAGFEKRDCQEFVNTTNEETFISVQIESRKAIENIDQILSVKGIDAAVIGRGDMALDLGFPGQEMHPQVIEYYERLVDACQRHGKIPCMMVPDMETAAYWIQRGVRHVTFGTEFTILMNTYQESAEKLRGVIKKVTGK